MRYYEDPAVGQSDPAKFPQFAAPTNWRLDKLEESLRRNDKLFVERKGNANNFTPRHPTFFSAKVSKGASIPQRPHSKVDA